MNTSHPQQYFDKRTSDYFFYRPEYPFNSFINSLLQMFGIVVLPQVIAQLSMGEPMGELFLVRQPYWALGLTMLCGALAWVRERYIYRLNEAARFGDQS
jgi:hypothetical protein